MFRLPLHSKDVSSRQFRFYISLRHSTRNHSYWLILFVAMNQVQVGLH
uniref:Uncharacterized protein n=1 Tax=Arundo donax TaxID=35708 RepID=A0A0A9AUV1_ARUDO